MKRLFAPWRANHAKSVAQNKNDNASVDYSNTNANDTQECVFCPQLKVQEITKPAKNTEFTKNPDLAKNQNLEINKDRQNFILKRFTHSVVMLNKFPYNAGHILILPKRHVATLSELSPEERCELIELSCKTSEILEKCLQNHGLNIGINIGKASGASIPTHLHVHVLPRFNGDTNFLPVLAETKIISFDLGEIYDKLKLEFDKISI